MQPLPVLLLRSSLEAASYFRPNPKDADEFDKAKSEWKHSRLEFSKMDDQDLQLQGWIVSLKVDDKYINFTNFIPDCVSN